MIASLPSYEYLLVYTTVSSLEDARSMAHALIKEKLAACVNIISPVLSIYTWEENIVEETEFTLLIKTRAVLLGELEAKIKSLHPYEIPCIAAISFTHLSKEFADWLDTELEEGK